MKQLNTDTNFVCIENKYIQQDDFVLRQPRKGKIIKGTYHNAYNRESLGSIPRKTENVLFRDNLCPNKLGFNSQSIRFGNNNTSNEVLFTNENNNSSKDNKQTSQGSPSFSSKGYCNGFVSKTDRFPISYSEYENKYLPGPGEHKINKHTISNIIKNSNNYKSLFKNNSPGRVNNYETPGVGEYNLRTEFLNAKKQGGNFSTSLGEEIKLKLKNKKNLKDSQYSTTTNSINEKSSSISNSINNDILLNNITKQTKIYSNSFLNKNKLNGSYTSLNTEESTELKNKFSNFRGKNAINNYDLDSYLLLKMQNINDHKAKKNLIKEIFNLKRHESSIIKKDNNTLNDSNAKNNIKSISSNNNKINSNSIMDNIRKDFHLYNESNISTVDFLNNINKEDYDNYKNTDLININNLNHINNNSKNTNDDDLTKNEFLQSYFSKVDIKLQENKEIVKNKMDKEKQEQELLKKIQQIKSRPAHYFTSSSPKIIFNKKNSHVPGPTYYNPLLIPNKLSFNINNKLFSNNLNVENGKKDDVWI